MTDDFFWGGINIRKVCSLFFKNFWMIIAVMIITYLGLDLVDQRTYSPTYTYTAVAAVYPMSSSYRYHTIENAAELSSKTGIIGSVFNTDVFQSEFYNQYPDLQDCVIDCTTVENTDLLIMHATSGSPESAYEGIPAALDFYSRFSGNMTGAADIKIIFRQEAPTPIAGSSKIQNNRSKLSILSGLMMAGLFLLLHVVKNTYKTERCLRKRHKNVRFFSLPFSKYGQESKKGIILQKNCQPPIRKLALEIKQALYKSNKSTVFVTSYADKDRGAAFLSVLARELSEQNEKVILIGTDDRQRDDPTGLDASDDMKKYTLQDILLQKCSVKDALFYREELKGNWIECDPDSMSEEIAYSIDDARRVLTDCLEYADFVLVDGAAMFPSNYAQIWQEAADASIALCRQDNAVFSKVDQMLNTLQNLDTYFVGCVLSGF